MSEIQPTNSPSSLGYDPYFIPTEFEAIQSDIILGTVVQSLNLNTEWGRKCGGGELKTPETVRLLKRSLKLRRVRCTSFIEIQIISEDPSEAAQIANAIAETYRDHWLERRRQSTLDAIRVLEDLHREQTQKIEDAQNVVKRLRDELNITETEDKVAHSE
jgi:hypothetical protein